MGARSALCTDSSPAFLTHICGNVLQIQIQILRMLTNTENAFIMPLYLYFYVGSFSGFLDPYLRKCPADAAKCTVAFSLPFAREVKFACQLPERSCLRVNRGSWCLFKVLVAVQAGNAEEQIFVNGVLFSYLTFSKDKTLSRGFSSSNLVWPCKE